MSRRITSRLEWTGEIIKSGNLRKGMIVNKEPDADRGFEVIKELTGMCLKGYHFGNGCFDKIAEWYVYEEKKAPANSVSRQEMRRA